MKTNFFSKRPSQTAICLHYTVIVRVYKCATKPLSIYRAEDAQLKRTDNLKTEKSGKYTNSKINGRRTFFKIRWLGLYSFDYKLLFTRTLGIYVSLALSQKHLKCFVKILMRLLKRRKQCGTQSSV
jgi:hypothetical protein